jgi:hypothetical protein
VAASLSASSRIVRPAFTKTTRSHVDSTSQPDRGGLAGAVWTEKPEDLSAWDGQREVGHVEPKRLEKAASLDGEIGHA